MADPLWSPVHINKQIATGARGGQNYEMKIGGSCFVVCTKLNFIEKCFFIWGGGAINSSIIAIFDLLAF